jgi:hypothetical protein
MCAARLSVDDFVACGFLAFSHGSRTCGVQLCFLSVPARLACGSSFVGCEKDRR